ncbi:MAG: hypothetical protein AB7O26_12885 [Planctomycetaceae bacterium]
MRKARRSHPLLDDDSQCVLAELLRRVAVRVTHFRQPHPYGSTVAVEELAEVDLVEPWVSLPVETDTIPVEIAGTSRWDAVERRVRFFNPQVREGMVTYDAELE